jgi:hypothetical protein
LTDLSGGDRRSEDTNGDGKVKVHDDMNKTIQSRSSDFIAEVGHHGVPNKGHSGEVVNFVEPDEFLFGENQQSCIDKLQHLGQIKHIHRELKETGLGAPIRSNAGVGFHRSKPACLPGSHQDGEQHHQR